LSNVAQAGIFESFALGSMVVEDLMHDGPMYDKLLDLPDLQ
jgi:hypothetical protein